MENVFQSDHNDEQLSQNRYLFPVQLYKHSLRIYMDQSNPTQQIDDICDAFEEAWLAGTSPSVDEWVTRIQPEFQPRLLTQLVRVDLEYRLRDGAADVSLSQYFNKLGLAPDDFTLHHSSPTDVAEAGDETLFDRYKQSRVSQPQLSAFGEYEVLEEIGRGGMGIVYKARHRTLGRIVALKTIPAIASHDAEMRRRFQTEAEATAHLDHPGIVPVFEVGEEDGIPWFAMAFIEGETLRDQIRRQPLTCPETATVVLQVTEALHFAHTKGVVHRDVKPSNVLVAPDGTARLTDFGLAKLAAREESLTASGEILGTAAYMSPEQATGESITADVCSDVYSVGSLLYCCLTGHPPFQAATAVEILRQVIEDEPVEPRRLNAEVDIELQVICLKCLQKEPRKRYSNAAELTDELRRYLNNEPIQARPVSKSYRAFRWCMRRPFVAASGLLAAALLLVLTIAVPYTLIQRSEREQAEKLATANAARAATQEYYTAVQNVREMRLLKEPGWTWRALGKLEYAAVLPADGKDVAELRSLMVSALMAPDLRPVATFAEGVDTSDVAASRDGRFVALCEVRGSESVAVKVYNIDTPDVTAPQVLLYRTFEVPLEKHPSEKPDGFRSVCFSNDGTRIAAGTRHGDILEWSLHEAYSQRPMLHLKSDRDSIYQVAYSSDDQYLVSGATSPQEVQVWDRTTKQCLHSFQHLPDRFAAVRSGQFFFGLPDGVMKLDLTSEVTSRRLPWDKNDQYVMSLNTSADGSILSEATHIYDTASGQRTIELLSGDFEQSGESVHTQDRYFVRDESLIFSAANPRRIRLWDGLSGAIACDFAVSDREIPVTTYIDSLDLISVSGHSQTQLLDVRRPSALFDDAHRSREASNTYDCFEAFAPSAWKIAAFDMNSEGSELTILEGTEVDVNQRRVRTFKLKSGVETNRWTARNLGPTQTYRITSPSQGLFVSERAVDATLEIPRFPFRLTEEGFEARRGLNMPVIESQPQYGRKDGLRWEFPKKQAADSPFPYLQPCVTIHLPRSFPQEGESLELQVTCGRHNETYLLNSAEFMPNHHGWMILSGDYVATEEHCNADLTIRLELTSNQLRLATDSLDLESSGVRLALPFLSPPALFPIKAMLTGFLQYRVTALHLRLTMRCGC